MMSVLSERSVNFGVGELSMMFFLAQRENELPVSEDILIDVNLLPRSVVSDLSFRGSMVVMIVTHFCLDYSFGAFDSSISRINLTYLKV